MSRLPFLSANLRHQSTEVFMDTILQARECPACRPTSNVLYRTDWHLLCEEAHNSYLWGWIYWPWETEILELM